VPLLARTITAPLAVEIRAGAVGSLASLLSDRRISSGGHVAVVVGPGQGEALARVLAPVLGNALVLTAADGTIEGALELAGTLRGSFYDAVVGIGGGRVIDVAKYAATMVGLPMVAVATNLAHDGLCSPVASLVSGGRKGSYGVAMPLAVVVDLDYVRRSPLEMRRAGVGDVLSNLAAIADWELAARERGEAIDGLAVTFARTAAESVIARNDGVDDDRFLTALAEALVLSGLAMSVAGSSRPCSGGDHEVLHAVDHLFPGTSNHGELAGVGALLTTFLRGDTAQLDRLSDCLAQHGLARTPADLGLTEEQLVEAVQHAPLTRPDRYTILEHLDLTADQTREHVRDFVTAIEG
jgi:glycerol-1-phosphate dehydrogenase [NAD(P)+]